MGTPVDDRLMWEAHQNNNEDLVEEGKAEQKLARKAAGQYAPRFWQKARRRIAGAYQGARAAGGSKAGQEALERQKQQREKETVSAVNAKINSIITSYFTKIQELESELEDDLEKIGVTDVSLGQSNPEAWKALQALRSAVGTLTLKTQTGQGASQVPTTAPISPSISRTAQPLATPKPSIKQPSKWSQLSPEEKKARRQASAAEGLKTKQWRQAAAAKGRKV